MAVMATLRLLVRMPSIALATHVLKPDRLPDPDGRARGLDEARGRTEAGKGVSEVLAAEGVAVIVTHVGCACWGYNIYMYVCI